MNALKTQVSLMQFLFIIVTLIAFASSAEAQKPPVDVNPGKTAVVGEYLFRNNTDKRCVASVKADKSFSVGCSDLGNSKSGKPAEQGRTIVIIDKVKDKWGKADEVALRVDRK